MNHTIAGLGSRVPAQEAELGMKLPLYQHPGQLDGIADLNTAFLQEGNIEIRQEDGFGEEKKIQLLKFKYDI